MMSDGAKPRGRPDFVAPYFNAEAQRRRVRRGDGRVEHVERVEGGECESGGSVAPRRSNEE